MKGLRSIFTRGQACMPLTNVEGRHVKKYRFFKSLLTHNHSALKTLAELEQLYYSGRPFTLSSARSNYEELLEAVFGVIYSLEYLSGQSYSSLKRILRQIDSVISEEITPRYAYSTNDIVLPFERITPELKKMVGAKAGHLALIKNNLGLPVPDGFAVTAYAFELFVEENGLLKPIERELCRMSPDSLDDIKRAGSAIQAMIRGTVTPARIAEQILGAYAALEEKTSKGVRIAMRSSAIGEDTEATFAGQYTTVLNVTRENIIDAYKTVLASKYSAKAISYRVRYGLDDRETPMAVAGIAMVDPQSSGVVYTGEGRAGSTDFIKINALWGLGEQLVDGSASPDMFLVDKTEDRILAKDISRKEYRLVNLQSGGTEVEKVSEDEQEMSSIDDAAVIRLARYGRMLEEFFGSPQDIEWVLDKNGSLFILQSRPLSLSEKAAEEEHVQEKFADHQIVFAGGKTASPGAATGRVVIAQEGRDISHLPENTILVAKTASPDYAALMGKINGLITDIGSITSHLSSIAREFGVPALVDTKNATALLPDGAVVTLSATTATVYMGIVEALAKDTRPSKRLVIESPVHKRMRTILDKTSPLNLTDPGHPSFSPEGCRTVHDIIRFTHEQAMRAMFGLTEEAEEVRAVRLTAAIPLIIHLIDLGGGLRQGLTTCDAVVPEHIESIPMAALWKGFTHPGITWEGTINLDMKNIITLFASSAVSEFGETPGGISYALLSGEYMNLSAKFGYHFATIDALCGEDSNQNYISLQFSGGAGNYYGKSLRVSFLGNVLRKLGFQVSLKGDLLEASLLRYDKASMEDKIDQLGRLLASSRLLDMALSSQADIELATDSFFKGEYDFLNRKRPDQLNNFYTYGGNWKKHQEDGHSYCVQDGSKAGFSLSSGMAGIVGKLVGPSLQDFLDNIEAYYYFPIAIAKDSDMADGTVSARIKPVSGHIDRAGGIIFGLRNASNYYVLRINALEDNVILFEYINNKRIQRINVQQKISSNAQYELKVGINGKHIKGYLDGRLIVEYSAENPVRGFVGLWTKADSVTWFDELTIQTDERKENIECH